MQTILNLGLLRMVRIGLSYSWACVFQIKPERSLEDFFINRFGRELYATFFKDYTEKVWGVSCKEIKPEWGAQRIKGLSITKAALLHAAASIFKRDRSVAQKNTETSLIDRFLYPKFGPGQMWEEVAGRVASNGVKLHHQQLASRIEWSGNRITAVGFKDNLTKTTSLRKADFYFSTMPIKDLVECMFSAGCAGGSSPRSRGAGLPGFHHRRSALEKNDGQGRRQKRGARRPDP